MDAPEGWLGSAAETSRRQLRIMPETPASCPDWGASHPAAFDSVRLQSAAEALARKRIRCMQRAHPLVQEICPRDNDSILEALHQFIRENPSVHPQGPYFDALAFLSYLGLKSSSSLGWKPSRLAVWKAAFEASWRALCSAFWKRC